MKNNKFLSTLVVGFLLGAMTFGVYSPANATTIKITGSGDGTNNEYSHGYADASMDHKLNVSENPSFIPTKDDYDDDFYWDRGDDGKDNLINMTGGTLSIRGFDNSDGAHTTGRILAQGGEITLYDNYLTIIEDSEIGHVKFEIKNNSFLNITGGSVILNSDDTISGTINFSAGRLYIGGGTDLTNATINATGGTLKLTGTNTFNNNTTIGNAVALEVYSEGTQTFANASSIETDFSNAGKVIFKSGEIGVNISNSSGTTEIAGDVTNSAAIGQNVNVTSGILTNASGGSVSGTTTISSDATVLNTAGILADVTNGGTLTVSGGHTGAVTNNNSMTVSGTDNTGVGAVTNNKTLSITGGIVASVNNANAANSVATQSAGTVLGNITNAGAYSISGGLINGTVSNSGSLTVSGGTISAVNNTATGTNGVFQSNGTVTSVNNTGKYDLTGGTITNYSQSTGNLYISNGASLAISNATNPLTSSVSAITGGNVQLGEDTNNTAGTLVINNGSENQAKLTTAGTGSNAFSVTGANTTFTTLTDTNFANGSVTVGDGSTASVLNLSNNGIIAKEVTLTVDKASTMNISGTAQATINNDDTWNGAVTVNGGKLELNGRADVTDNTKTFNQSAGKLTIVNGGSLTLNTSDSKIDGTSEIILGEDTNNTAGTLVINNGLTTNQAKVITSGTGSNAFSVTGENTTFTTLTDTNFANGSVTVGDGSTASVLNLSNNGIIAKEVTLTVDKASTMNISGTAQATINSGDTWNGSIEQSAGTVTHLNEVVKNANDATYKVTGGNVNIGNNTTAGTLTLNNANDSIASAAAVTINGNSKLSQSAGTVVLDNNNDTWNGAISLSGSGDLTLNGRADVTDNTKTFNQSAGKLTIVNGGSLTLNTSDSKIDGTSEIVLGEDTNNTAGTLVINNGLTTNQAKVITSGTGSNAFSVTGENTTFTTLTDTNFANGSVTVGDGSTASVLNLSNNGIIAKEVTLTVDKASTMNISDTASAIIDNATDTYAGDVKMIAGSLEMKDLTIKTGKSSTTDGGVLPYYEQKGGVLTLTNTKLSMTDSSLISRGDLTVDTNSTFNSLSNAFSINNLTSAGLINGINRGYENYAVANDFVVGDTSGDNKADFMIDIYARSSSNYKYDSFGSDSTKIKAANGTNGVLHVSNWALNGDLYGYDAPIERHYNLDKLFKGSVETGTINFTATDKEVFTPIGWYGLHSKGGGKYTLDLNRYNPGVFRGQVSKIAQYQNQLMIDDILFSHTMIDQGFKGNNYIVSNPNRIASSSDIFPPYQYSRKDGGL